MGNISWPQLIELQKQTFSAMMKGVFVYENASYICLHKKNYHHAVTWCMHVWNYAQWVQIAWERDREREQELFLFHNKLQALYT